MIFQTAVAFPNLESLSAPAYAGAKLGTIITDLLNYVFVAAGFLLILYILYGGFHLMMAKGEPKAIQEAQGKITGALTGFVIVFVAFWIVQVIAQLFGVSRIIDIFQ